MYSRNLQWLWQLGPLKHVAHVHISLRRSVACCVSVSLLRSLPRAA